MRHLHDLTFLTKQFNIDDTFREHFLDVFNFDMKFRLKEDISLDEIIKDVLTILRTDKKYEIDFVRYVSNMSYAKTSEQLTYDKALDSFFKLMKDIKKRSYFKSQNNFEFSNSRKKNPAVFVLKGSNNG